MIQLKHFVFNELGVNSFVLHDHTRECIIIDPGCNTPSQQQEMAGYVAANNLTPRAIVLTHGHFDHILGNKSMISLFKCDLVMHRDDLHQVQLIKQFAGIFGFDAEESPAPDRFVAENDVILFGESVLKVLHVPGHSPGSICLYSENDKLLICGDVLFAGSIGRTDLPGGNHDLLLTGIRQKLMVLPGDTVVWPGHGPKTSIGYEHDTNPFLN